MRDDSTLFRLRAALYEAIHGFYRKGEQLVDGVGQVPPPRLGLSLTSHAPCAGAIIAHWNLFSFCSLESLFVLLIVISCRFARMFLCRQWWSGLSDTERPVEHGDACERGRARHQANARHGAMVSLRYSIHMIVVVAFLALLCVVEFRRLWRRQALDKRHLLIVFFCLSSTWNNTRGGCRTLRNAMIRIW